MRTLVFLQVDKEKLMRDLAEIEHIVNFLPKLHVSSSPHWLSTELHIALSYVSCVCVCVGG